MSFKHRVINPEFMSFVVDSTLTWQTILNVEHIMGPFYPSPVFLLHFLVY